MSSINNEKDFFKLLALKAGIQQKEARKFYYAMLDVIEESANSSDGSKTRIPNFGVLEVFPKDPYISRDPRDSRAVIVETRRRSKLRLLPKFKRRLSTENYKEYMAKNRY